MNSFSGEINLGNYEKEKLETTKDQLRRIADTIELTIKMLEYCESQDIFICSRPDLHDLRSKDGLCGPESDISKLETKLEKVQLAILKELSERQIEDVERALSLRFTSDEKVRKKTTKPKQAKGYNG